MSDKNALTYEPKVINRATLEDVIAIGDIRKTCYYTPWEAIDSQQGHLIYYMTSLDIKKLCIQPTA